MAKAKAKKEAPARKPKATPAKSGRGAKKGSTGKKVETPAERGERHAERATRLATRTARFTGRTPDSADGPPLAEADGIPHPQAGTEVDQVGGIAEIAHVAGRYGLDSVDYGDRLNDLTAKVGASVPKDMDERDAWTRKVALHDALIKAAREGNAVEDMGEVIAEVGLDGKGKRLDDVKAVLSEAGLNPGNL